MKETTLRFLMHDGAAAYTFQPALTPEQYAELHTVVKEQHSMAELLEALQAFSAKWHKKLVIDTA